MAENFLSPKDGEAFEKAWDLFLRDENPHSGPKYTRGVWDYFRLVSGSRFLENLSFVVMKAGRPVAIAPLMLENLEGVRHLTHFNEAVPYPAISLKLGTKEADEIEAVVFKRILDLMKQNSIVGASFMESPQRRIMNPHILPYAEKCGWLKVPLVSTVLDLTLSEEALWSSVRHSYRALINKSKKQSEFVFYDSTNFTREVGERYRLMHQKAAGRVTRSIESFERMYAWIESGEGYLIEQICEGKPVAYIVIMRQGEHLFYASLADDPEADQDKVILHGWVWQAMMEFKKRGHKSLELGLLYYGPLFSRSINRKWQGISRFKSGFGGQHVTINEYHYYTDPKYLSQWIKGHSDRLDQSARELWALSGF